MHNTSLKCALVSLLALASEAAAAKTPVNQATFDALNKYALFAGASYANICEKPANGASVVRYFNAQATDTQATLFKDDAAREIILSFRGTSTPGDLDRDFNFGLQPLTAVGTKCSGCQVHTGFQQGYNAISQDVISGTRSALAASPDYALVLTGHSLGGSLAALAASSFVGSGIAVDKVYTYGEPQNGNPEWAKYITSQIPVENYFRVTNANDGVPQIPPAIIGYQHHHWEYFYTKPSGNTPATVLNCGANNLDCNNREVFGLNPINKAHITYGNGVTGNSLFVTGCGAVFP